MKKFTLLFASIIGLSGCESFNEIQSSLQNLGTNLTSGVVSNVVSNSGLSCATSGSGLDRFKSCPLDIVVEDLGDYSSTSALSTALKSEYGTVAKGLAIQFNAAGFVYHSPELGNVVQKYYREFQKGPYGISQSNSVRSIGNFEMAAREIKSCRNFNESEYRTSFSEKYGSNGAERANQEIATFKARCDYLNKTQFKNSAYYIDQLKKYLAEKSKNY